MRPVVHSKDAAHDVPVAAVTLLPILVAEHEHCVAARLFVVWNEGPAKNRLHAEHVEEVCRHYTGLHALRLAATVEYETHRVVLDHLHRFVLISIILEFPDREAETVHVVEASLLIQHNQTVPVFVRKWAQ